MNNDLSALFAKIGAQAKRAVCPGMAVLLRGAQRAAAAASIARCARLPLYRIDLNAVTRKYIGETEKNLDAVFDTAERKRFVLFFDEADGLFGKRSEIKRPGDRPANDVVYVLAQRIAKFNGVVALAAAEASVIDPALRRAFCCEIQLPDLETDVDVEIVADNIHALAAIYFAYMLEEAGFFATVDRIAALFVALELRKQVSDLIALLSNPEVAAAFGARDMWQVIDQVSMRELGGARNTACYATMAVSGAKIVDWLAARAAMLQDNEWEAADGDLVAACESWLAVDGVADESVEEYSQQTESPMVAGESPAIPPIARDLLEALGCDLC